MTNGGQYTQITVSCTSQGCRDAAEENPPLAGAAGAGESGLPLLPWDVPGSCCAESVNGNTDQRGRLEEGPWLPT